MFRLRRYRVFIVFAVITVGLLYHFASITDLDGAVRSVPAHVKDTTPAVDSTSSTSPEGAEGKEKAPDEVPKPEELSKPEETPKLESFAAPRIQSGHHDAQHGVEDDSPGSNAGLVAETSSGKSPPTQQISSASDSAATPEVANPKGHPKTPSRPMPPQRNTTSTDEGPAEPQIDPLGGGGRLEVIGATGKPKIHWTPLPEHFPIPTDSLIPLPTGKPKDIPHIQHEFRTETSTEKMARQGKLDFIRKTFSFSWKGYRAKAWLQDELSPISGKYRNPFCGWGATLVDTLDTLWIMDMKEEFEEAVEAVKEIDFTTSTRNDIPLFETVIRYLGGLIGAYDISGGSYKVLLDKAVELADVLMGAFDTPNRMPLTFYLWKPTFASQPHRAKTRVVLAELGSLSIEFTRLAQITKEAKYYDAIARITNELEILQKETKIPGLWPQNVDASGCKKPDRSISSLDSQHDLHSEKPIGISDSLENDSPYAVTESSLTGPISREAPETNTTSSEADSEDGDKPKIAAPVKDVYPSDHTGPAEGAPVPAATREDHNRLRERSPPEATVSSDSNSTDSAQEPDCEPQGLASPPNSFSETFGVGGQADSTYEYLPKEFMLLGGLEDKYQTMYEMAADATIKNLLFRPMLPDESRHVLQAGLRRTNGKDTTDSSRLVPEGTHLTCFVGGMFAIGSKIFNREADLDRAKKLTDGCVWAYGATHSGVMPEGFLSIPCADSAHCPWNETLWREMLDPYGDQRENIRGQQMKEREDRKKAKAASTSTPTNSTIDKGLEANSEAPTEEDDKSSTKFASKPSAAVVESTPKVESKKSDPTDGPKSLLRRRQLGEIDDPSTSKPMESVADKGPELLSAKVGSSTEGLDESKPVSRLSETINFPSVTQSLSAEHSSSPSSSPITEGQDTEYEPPLAPSREEFVQNRIKNENLPIGMSKLSDRKYILRPEAIESVFIMYRVTGEEYWREKGWKMFEAIEKLTNGTYGATAVSDVTSDKFRREDKMESFWLAETLKYFYLLFSEPTLVNLDEYILNTEAHPFKRPTG